MDMSMILGLTIAGSIVMLSGNKKPSPKPTENKTNNTEFIVRIADGGDVAVGPKL
ncbi:MAG: hypothetical protein AAFY17_07675 [Cyanobacteria bacterium J06642_11]